MAERTFKVDFDYDSNGKEISFINQHSQGEITLEPLKMGGIVVKKAYIVADKKNANKSFLVYTFNDDNIKALEKGGMRVVEIDGDTASKIPVLYFKGSPISYKVKTTGKGLGGFFSWLKATDAERESNFDFNCYFPCCSYEINKTGDEYDVQNIKEFNINWKNLCNFTSLSMALKYGGWEEKPTIKNITETKYVINEDDAGETYVSNNYPKEEDFYLEDNSTMVSKMIQMLIKYYHHNGYSGWSYKNLEMPEDSGKYEPQTSIENMKIIAQLWIDSEEEIGAAEYKSGFGSEESYFKAITDKCVIEEDNTKYIDYIPILRVKGYFDENGNFKSGGHYVCCSGIVTDENMNVKYIKVDDPWGYSPSSENDSSGSTGSDGNNVLWKASEFYKKFINGEKNDSILFVKAKEERVKQLILATGYADYETQQQLAELSNVENFIESWSCIEDNNSSYSKSDKAKQGLLNIDHYYDFLSGMTPFVEVGFRYGFKPKDEKADEGYPYDYKPLIGYINSIEHPFIKSLSVEDNGVKTVTLELFDKSFGSFHNYFLRNNHFTTDAATNTTGKTDVKFSLEQLIRLSLRDDIFEDEDPLSGLKFSENEVSALGQNIDKTYPISYSYNGSTYYITLGFDYNYESNETNIKENIKENIKKQIGATVSEDTLNDLTKKVYNQYSSKCKYTKNNLSVYKEEGYYNNKYSSETSSDSSEEDEEVAEAENDYLKFSKLEKKASYTNLIVRFGYADYNIALNSGERNNQEAIDYYKNTYATTKRTNRWWDVTYGAGVSWTVLANSWVESNEKKTKEEGKDGHSLNNDNANYNTNAENSTANVSQEEQLESQNQTTSMSRNIELKIFGYEKKLTRTGLSYTINAVETKEQRILSQRFLQRYTEIVSYPEEVLYTLMHIFNENKGEIVETSPVRILFLQDKSDTDWAESEIKKKNTELASNIESASKVLSQDYDLSLLKEQEQSDGTAVISYKDTYNSILNGEAVLPKYLKKITLSLGNESSLSNYKQVREEPPKYKSIGALMNEFCAACPPKKLQILDQEKHYDKETGEEIEIDTANQMSRPLKWFSVQDGDEIYIILYYRRELKPMYIRSYDWGPALPFKTCVTDVNIRNTSEFALMTAVKSFNADECKTITRMKKEDGNNKGFSSVSQSITSEDIKGGVSVNLLATTDVASSAYGTALSSGVYEGTIEMLGDPFYLFDGLIQPCTYPIKLNVYVPVDEWEWKNNSELSSVVTARGNNSYYGNQRLEDMSGYYVIKKINHSISNGSFKTTLEVLSYPNIEKMILKDPSTTLKEI